jgi:hypothetical protein
MALVLVRSHDEPLGGWTDKIKRVARHQRKRGFGGGSQNTLVIVSDDLRPIDRIAGQATRGLKLNLVILADVFQSTEKRVAVPGDSDVAGFPGKRSARDVPDSQPQHSRAGALQHCDGHSQPGDIHAAQNVTCLGRGFVDYQLRVIFVLIVFHLLFLNFLFMNLDLIFQGAFCGDLVEPGFEQSDPYVSKQENPGDKQQTLSPAKKPWFGCGVSS